MRIFILVVCLAFSGCAELFSRAVGGPESPRPKEYQTESSERIVTASLPVIVEAQTNKQDNITAFGEKALEALKDAKTPEQVAGITDVFAKGAKFIMLADGTQKTVGTLLQKTTADVLNMPFGEYLAYTAGQTIVASRNQELAIEGIKVGWQWTSGKIAGTGGLLALITGLGSWGGINWFRRRKAEHTSKALVKGTDRVKAKFPEKAEDINNEMAREAAKAPVDVNAEVDRLRKS